MQWQDIENAHIRDLADLLSERALALEEAVNPLTVADDWQENLHDHGLAFMENMVLRIHAIAEDLSASLEDGRDEVGSEDDVE